MDLLKASQPPQPLPETPREDTKTHGSKDDGIADLVHRLDPDKRAVVALYYLEDLTIAEICSLLRIPAGTVKSRLYSARNALRSL
jgi:RNA polymerase sigma factor (sigma-70 family)